MSRSPRPDAAVLFNPAAGRGRARRRLKRLQSFLESTRLHSEWMETRRPGHARELAAECRDRSIPLVIAAGGDGTVSEAASSLIYEGGLPDTDLMAWPLGSGNDFIANTGSAHDWNALCRTVLEGRRTVIDTGRLDRLDPPADPMSFVNNLGAGLEADVIAYASSFKKLRGMPLYLAATLRSITAARPHPLHLQLDAQPPQSQEVSMLSIANGARTGGGFRLLPDATVDDGQLDLGLLTEHRPLPLLGILTLAVVGRHRSLQAVQLNRTRTIHITSEQGLFVHLDGDRLDDPVHECQVSIRPSSLAVRIPDRP